MSDQSLLVDSHVHVASPDRARYPVAPTGIGSAWWQGGGRTAEAFVTDMDRVEVAAAILVQAVGPYGFDNSYVLAATAAEPRFSAVVAVDLDGDDPEAEIRRLARAPSVTGVRFFGMTEARRWIRPDSAVRFLAVAGDCGLSVVFTVTQDDLVVLRRAIESSSTVIALDHCGFPEYHGGEIRDDQVVLSLADVSNVHLKVTTQCFRHSGDPQRLLAQLVGLYGHHRLLWGSDYPQTHDRYSDCVALARTASAGFEEDQRRAYLGGNTGRIFGEDSRRELGECPPDVAAVSEALRSLAETLAADGYSLDVSTVGDDARQFALEVSAGPESCPDCLVTKETFAAIAVDRLGTLGIAATEIDLRYPADLDGAQASS